MANSTVASYTGIDYQSRFFWESACRLFAQCTKVKEVGFEVPDIKYFDDVVVRFSEPIHDRMYEGCQAEYYQIKYHVDASGVLTSQNLQDPAFINVKKQSFLQRLLDAQRIYAPNGNEAVFILVTNWTIDPDDTLAKLVSGQDGELRLDLLIGDSASSEMRLLRQEWMQHLGLNSEADLRKALQTLRIYWGAGPIKRIQMILNQGLEIAGLRPVEVGLVVNQYDELIRKVRAENKAWFDRQDIEDICKRESLWIGRQPTVEDEAVQLGIRSFFPFAEHMEDETSEMICLAQNFDGRRARSLDLWQSTIMPEVGRFVQRVMIPGSAYHLRLDAHGSIAFAAGYYLGNKSGIEVAITQGHATGRLTWRLDPNTLQSTGPEWKTEEIPVLNAHGKDVALAISITQDVRQEVQAFIERSLPSVCKIIEFTVLPGPGNAAVRDASHAYRLVQEMIGWLPKLLSLDERHATYHIFASAPNYFQFQLGQQASSLGCCTLYEYAFGEVVPDYSPSITIPFKLPQLLPPPVVAA